MQATITLSTDRAHPSAIEYLSDKDLKKIPKDFAQIRKQWESGDKAGAKSALLAFLRASIGEPLHGGDDLCTTTPDELEPEFTIREVYWTDQPIPDLSIEMTVAVTLSKGGTVKSVSKAILEAATGEYADPETFGQVVSIEWVLPKSSFLLASADPWKFSMK